VNDGGGEEEEADDIKSGGDGRGGSSKEAAAATAAVASWISSSSLPRFVAGPVLVRKGPLAEASSRWVYKVVCADGALVRRGLELSSPHRCTLAPHSLLEVSERRINDQGLARLRTADGRGWVSEQLNPLSGQ
jgi:hypothetical protein